MASGILTNPTFSFLEEEHSTESGSSVGVVTRSADRRVRFSIFSKGKTFLSSPKVHTGCEAHASSYSLGTGVVSPSESDRGLP